MSNGYDFFGGSGTSAPGVQQRPAPLTTDVQSPMWQPPMLQAPMLQAPPRRVKSKQVWIGAGAVVVAVALAASALVFLHRSHPVPLPNSAGGFEATALPASAEAQFKQMRDNLAKEHIHDVASRVYGDLGNTQGLFVVAGRVSKTDLDVQEVSAIMNSQVASLGAGVSAGLVTSGSTQFECVSQNASGHTVAICYWWSQHAVLIGTGVDLDAQATADALDQVKSYAALT